MNLNSLFAELPPGHVTTIAGAPHETGVPAKEAHVGWPIGVVRRADGDLIVADWHANRLWRIDGDGILHAFAGDGVPGNRGDGGPALEARLRGPHSLTLDRRGNIYTADLANRTIRRIDAETGIITRVAGSGRAGRGGDGGPALEAELDVHCGIAVDGADNLYLSSEWQNTIRKVDARTGVIELFAGHDARHYPSEKGRSRPYLGKGLEDWGGLNWGGYHGDGGPAPDAYLSNPRDVSVDARGRAVIADTRHGFVRRVEESGIIQTIAGTGLQWDKGDGGPAASACMLSVSAVAHGPGGDIFLADGTIGRVRRIDAETGIITTVAGIGEPGYSGDGGPATAARIGSVNAIDFDGGGRMYLADTSNHAVRRVDAGGTITTVAGTGEPGCSPEGTRPEEARLNTPNGIAVTAGGVLYVCDSMNNRLLRCAPGRALEVVAGGEGQGFAGDGGPARQAVFNEPYGICLYGDEILLVTDYFNNRIRAIRLK